MAPTEKTEDFPTDNVSSKQCYPFGHTLPFIIAQ